MRFLKTKKGLALLAAIVSVAAAAVGAYAFFISTGSGSSTATIGNPSNWIVTVGSAVGADLTPGGPTDTFSYTVKNQSSGNQNLSGVTISIANSNGSAWTAVSGCSASDFSINGGSAGAPATDNSLAGDIAGGVTTSAGSISLQMADASHDQGPCAGATVPLYVVAS